MAEEIIRNVMWQVRLSRSQGRLPLTAETIQIDQAHIWGYDLPTVRDALAELSNRGYRWDQYFWGIPDTCMLVPLHIHAPGCG